MAGAITPKRSSRCGVFIRGGWCLFHHDLVNTSNPRRKYKSKNRDEFVRLSCFRELSRTAYIFGHFRFERTTSMNICAKISVKEFTGDNNDREKKLKKKKKRKEKKFLTVLSRKMESVSLSPGKLRYADAVSAVQWIMNLWVDRFAYFTLFDIFHRLHTMYTRARARVRTFANTAYRSLARVPPLLNISIFNFLRCLICILNSFFIYYRKQPVKLCSYAKSAWDAHGSAYESN